MMSQLALKERDKTFLLVHFKDLGILDIHKSDKDYGNWIMDIEI